MSCDDSKRMECAMFCIKTYDDNFNQLSCCLIKYAMKRTPARMTIMIVSVWLISALISIPPLFSGWKAPERENACTVSQDVSYQFYATIGAFYLPLAVMIVIYYRIYMVSSRIADAEAKSKPNGGSATFGAAHHAPPPRLHCVTYTPGGHALDSSAIKGSSSASMREGNGEQDLNKDTSSVAVAQLNLTNINGCKNTVDKTNLQLLSPPGEMKTISSKPKGSPVVDDKRKHKTGVAKTKRPMSLSNECKATKTLGIIMGAFTACWLPFFILALVKPFCTDSRSTDDENSSCIPHWLNSLFQWLGYANSFLNPIIYARFNREFRTPFKEILLLRCRGINVRLRTETYAEQFGADTGQSHREQCRSGCRMPLTNSTVVQYKTQGRPVVRLDDRLVSADNDAPKVGGVELEKSSKSVPGTNLDTNLGTELGTDLGTNFVTDLGTDFSTNLDTDLNTDLGTDLATDLGTDLGTYFSTAEVAPVVEADFGTKELSIICDLKTTDI